MATIRTYRTRRGERRYEVRFRDPEGRQRSRSFSVHKDGQAFKGRHRAEASGRHPLRSASRALWRRGPRLAGSFRAWRRGPRARLSTVVTAREVLAKLAPLNELSLERIRRPAVEDLMATIAGETPRRAEMALTLLKRILRSAEARGQAVDPAVFHVRVAKPEEREPRFLTWGEVDELRSWVPEYVSRIIPVAVLTMLRRGEILALRDRDAGRQLRAALPERR